MPVVDILVRITGGSSHSVDSSKIAFHIAGSRAMQAAAEIVKPEILEPVMMLEITVPLDYIGPVLRQVSVKRGQILSSEQSKDCQIVTALIPFAELLGYATDLRSVTQGHGIYTMEFHHYQLLKKPESEPTANNSGT